MILAFVDEAGDGKFKDYFGLCCAIINSKFYGNLKCEFQRILTDAGWDPNFEFKGSHLFSAKSGDPSINVDKRVEIASKILELNMASKNARMKFGYFKMKSETQKRDYLEKLPALISKILPKPDKKEGKNVLSLHCDNRSDVSAEEIRAKVKPIIEGKGYVLLEDVILSHSSFHTVGILFADLIAFLKARVDIISNDSDLFQSIPPEHFENNGKIRKLKTSTKLLEQIKNFKVIEL